MSRYIDADKIEEFANSLDSLSESRLMDALHIIATQIPSSDVAPVVHAKFTTANDGFVRCSACGKEIRYPLVSLSDIDYCPRCGAKMDAYDNIKMEYNIPMEYFENGGI